MEWPLAVGEDRNLEQVFTKGLSWVWHRPLAVGEDRNQGHAGIYYGAGSKWHRPSAAGEDRNLLTLSRVGAKLIGLHRPFVAGEDRNRGEYDALQRFVPGGTGPSWPVRIATRACGRSSLGTASEWHRPLAVGEDRNTNVNVTVLPGWGVCYRPSRPVRILTGRQGPVPLHGDTL